MPRAPGVRLNRTETAEQSEAHVGKKWQRLRHRPAFGTILPGTTNAEGRVATDPPLVRTSPAPIGSDRLQRNRTLLRRVLPVRPPPAGTHRGTPDRRGRESGSVVPVDLAPSFSFLERQHYVTLPFNRLGGKLPGCGTAWISRGDGIPGPRRVPCMAWMVAQRHAVRGCGTGRDRLYSTQGGRHVIDPSSCPQGGAQ